MKNKFGVLAQNFAIISVHSFPKISPSPPFDYAQGMLFQRGGLNFYGEIPPLKRGTEGDLSKSSVAPIV
jgi:hypothetical protein